ncbi:coatomer subunit beta [Allomyces javanicus]|nr:coatomer subunit beta [Allomyces javanicus]
MTDTACYTVIRALDSADAPTLESLRSALEKGSDDVKIATMKKLLRSMLNGEPYGTQLLMQVIRYVMPSRSKPLKKLLNLYWEVVPKHNADGKLKQEMILVCNALRNDLQHPNEYIRGASLRMVCKLRDAELLEPLVPSCRQNLDHRHPYVRKNAIFAVYSLYKHNQVLFPDAPTRIAELLTKETDMACRRNAFVMLQNTSPDLAIQYLASVAAQIPTFDEHVQLAVIELVRKEARANAAERLKYLKLLYALLGSPDLAVKYEAASSLVSLTSAPEAVKAAAQCYVTLLHKAADTNVKLIVLARIRELLDRHDRLAGDELALDLLRVLATPDMEVRRTCCAVALDMTTPRNVDQVVAVLKKELVKTQDPTAGDKAAEFRQLLIQTIHTCAVQFPSVAPSAVATLMDFLGDSSNASAVDVVAFVREVVERFPDLRAEIVTKLVASLNDLKSGKVARGALWIMGEYAPADLVPAVIDAIQTSLGEIVRMESTTSEPVSASSVPNSPRSGSLSVTTTTSSKVLADGSYATQTALTTTAGAIDLAKRKPPLQALLHNGDYFTGAVLATCLTKLVLRVRAAQGADSPAAHKTAADGMWILSHVLRHGLASGAMDEDSRDRVTQCLATMAEEQAPRDVQDVYLASCRSAFARLLAVQDKSKSASAAKNTPVIQVEDPISFGVLKRVAAAAEDRLDDDDYERDLTRATGRDASTAGVAPDNKLNRVVQLTGFSDPVYAEAYVTVHQFDIVLDVLIVNQTTSTLQNLALEFATLGDLKLVERPQAVNLAPKSYHTVKAHIKVASTETGVIFGNIVYDMGALDARCVILNDIHIDIMDYIHAAACTETQFRAMWTEFEWENKVNVATPAVADATGSAADQLRAYLKQVMAATNMACLTPDHALEGDCGVLAANLYAKSVFGEDALANLCVERTSAGSIVGHIRIRSKTQGIALALGDKITLSQKNAANAAAAAAAAV